MRIRGACFRREGMKAATRNHRRYPGASAFALARPSIHYIRDVSITYVTQRPDTSAHGRHMHPEPSRPLRGVELHILLSVIDRPRHGYGILQEAEARTEGRPGFEIPTLYRALRRLRDEGLIRNVEAPADAPDERREYWSATDVGRRALRTEMARLEVVLNVGRARMGDVTPEGAG